MYFFKNNLTSSRKLRLTYMLVASPCSGLTQPPAIAFHSNCWYSCWMLQVYAGAGLYRCRFLRCWIFPFMENAKIADASAYAGAGYYSSAGYLRNLWKSLMPTCQCMLVADIPPLGPELLWADIWIKFLLEVSSEHILLHTYHFRSYINVKLS